MKTYPISVGRSRTETRWAPKEVSWEQLCTRLQKEKRTAESVSDYKGMTKQAKGKVKDCGGFVGGSIDGGHRKADAMKMRSLVTLDIDYGQPETIGVVEEMMEGTAWCLYSTHSHTPEAPRYRLILPLSREVTPDEYIPIARAVANDIGINLFDDSTYEPCRLMYWPSCPRDAEYVFRKGEGAPVDADATLGRYGDWRNVSEWPVSRRVTRIVEGRGTRQEDPTTKPGLIGAFCRTYGISEVIDKYLPGVYTPTDDPCRYTYAAGSTACGVVVYEDKWAYSHHGTDPCCEKLCNSFDLVRLQLFGTRDAEADPDTPVNRMPSYTAMEALVLKDDTVAGVIAKERLSDINEAFEDLFPDADWVKDLKMDDRRKNFLTSPANFGLIMANDPQLKDCTRRDIFRGKDVVTADLPWRPKAENEFWTNSDDNGLIDYVSRTYNMASKQALLDAFDLAASQRSFHPVREYLNTLSWDGVERLDTLLSDYLGAEDTALTRAMTRKHFAAAVARVMRPGTKYDYVLTLIGPEGIGKSSLVKTLGGEWFDDSLTDISGKDAMEQIRGKWLVEMGELTNYKRSTSEAYKAFISKQEDSFRPAYGRHTETYPRQCVFFATTNESAFLKGDTGNRRFWTVECGADMASKDVFADLVKERDQIWAEALTRFRDGESLFLPASLEKAARDRQEQHNELAQDDRRGMIEAYIRMPLPETWDDMSIRQRRDYIQLGSTGMTSDEGTRPRRTVCAVEILAECFGQTIDAQTRYKTKEINQILRRLPELRETGFIRDKIYGCQRRYEIITTNEE